MCIVVSMGVQLLLSYCNVFQCDACVHFCLLIVLVFVDFVFAVTGMCSELVKNCSAYDVALLFACVVHCNTTLGIV